MVCTRYRASAAQKEGLGPPRRYGKVERHSVTPNCFKQSVKSNVRLLAVWRFLSQVLKALTEYLLELLDLSAKFCFSCAYRPTKINRYPFECPQQKAAFRFMYICFHQWNFETVFDRLTKCSPATHGQYQSSFLGFASYC